MEKTVLVTGASRGIGREVARQFAQNGYAVAIHYHQNKEMAQSLCEELSSQGFPCILVQSDVANRAQVEKMTEQVLTKFGHIDVLVNNAGIAQQKLFTDITEDDWDTLFNVNVKGMYHCCQSVLPGMIRRHSGKIINLSSIWGLTGASCEVHYSAAKAAVIGLTKALAKELGPSNIQVNCVAPGVIDTDMNKHLDAEIIAALKEETPLGVLGTPRDVANAVLFLAGDGGSFITGQVLSPNGGFVI
jgi:3-oxoacyl-[acyl-carrier protein] reductase